MKPTEDAQESPAYEVTLRAVGQALEALGVESFELIFEGETVLVYGGPKSAADEQKSSPGRFQLFRRKQPKKTPHEIYISGMRVRESDIKRLDHQGKATRMTAERCPDTNSLSHGLRMIGAHFDKLELSILRVVRSKGLFTVWHRSRSGGESKQIFTQANLYDLWVHLYKKRTEMTPLRTGTTNSA
jgi:hypothetical protein